MPKQVPIAAIDYGLSNVDVAVRESDGSVTTSTVKRPANVTVMQIDAVLNGLTRPRHARDFARVAITGGQHRLLPDRVDGIDVVKVPEVIAVGQGGLRLANVSEALVVSAGSGTAMIAARLRGKKAQHVTGTAVGGGTLLGLGHLLLNTHDPIQIDALAQNGQANQVDLTLLEATGGKIGKLPSDANAVNFGKLAKWPDDAAPPTREDIAAGLVRMVAQVIAVIAINAARAEKLDKIVVIGHLVDLPTIRQTLQTVAGYYGAEIIIPTHPGTGTVLGALAQIED